MHAPKVAYRSLRPEIAVPAARAAAAARKDALKAINDFVDKRFPGFVPVGFFHFDGSFHITGIALEHGITARAEVPVGMRYDTKRKAIVPAKKTDEGKALQKELDAFTFEYPYVDGLGGIISAFNGDPKSSRHERQHYFLGWTFHVLDREDGTTDVFATLPVDHLDERPQRELIERGDAWEPVRLSVFHVASEEHDEIAAVTQA